MHKPLKNKRILITAGPTWVPIDRVRVISNISSGWTGMTIAQHAVRKGAKVTLVLGPVPFEISKIKYQKSNIQTKNQKLTIIRFKFFNELQKLITQELKRHKYDIIIHSAAVSDYRPVKVFDKKIKSGKKLLTISLRPTFKIIDKIRKYAKRAFLIMFKLEVKRSKKELVDIAYENMRHSKADLIVANNIDEISENKHKAYIIDMNKKIIDVETKDELTKVLLRTISKKLNRGD